MNKLDKFGSSPLRVLIAWPPRLLASSFHDYELSTLPYS